ncbi:MAG: GDSL-type esterase/lipase family protein [Victivallaceae bacterium]|nr:GDSL-type esterase/lipase family protein [Victivallaceae bacterium]
MFKKITVLTMLATFCAASVLGSTKRVLVVNKGIGGHASADGLKRFQRDVLDVKPNYLILYFGMNDSHNRNRRVEPAVFRKNMQTMIDRAKTGGIKNIILVTINPVNQEILQKRVGKHPAKNDLNGYLKKFDVIVRELAEKNRLPLVDLRALCNKYGGGDNVKQALIRVDANGGRGDGVHLNAKGCQKFAELFIPVFKGKIKPGDVVVCFGDSITYGAHIKGGGTITGATYPAWLSLYLNQLVGATKRQSPPPPFIVKGSPKNGDMEYCSDRIRPDLWSVWNVKKRQEGDSRIAVGAGVTGNALKVINSNSKYPAFLLSLDLIKIRSSKKYSFSFQYKGSGQIRPIIGFYGKRNKALGSFPKNVKSNPWRKGTAEWQTDSITLEIPDGSLKMRACFRITGTILLDNVKFSSNVLKKNSRPPPLN